MCTLCLLLPDKSVETIGYITQKYPKQIWTFYKQQVSWLSNPARPNTAPPQHLASQHTPPIGTQAQAHLATLLTVVVTGDSSRNTSDSYLRLGTCWVSPLQADRHLPAPLHQSQLAETFLAANQWAGSEHPNTPGAPAGRRWLVVDVNTEHLTIELRNSVWLNMYNNWGTEIIILVYIKH